MRKLMICLSALFLTIFCVVTVTADPGSKVARHYDGNDEKVVIFIKGEGKTEEIAKAIQEKVKAKIINLDKVSEDEIKKSFEEGTLLLVGISENGTDMIKNMKAKWTGTEIEDKKCSFFCLSSEESENNLDLWEENAENEFHVKVVPGLFLTWDEGVRDEELFYIDGWLTTAFTYGENFSQSNISMLMKGKRRT